MIFTDNVSWRQESHLVDKASEVTTAAKGITKFFGGVGKRRESLKP